MMTAGRPYPGPSMPNGRSAQSTMPPCESTERQAYAFTSYEAHSGIRTALTRP